MGSSIGALRRAQRFRRPIVIVVGVVVAVAVAALVPRWWCGRDADAWFDGDAGRVRALAEELVAFEADDDRRAATGAATAPDGMWGLLAHQMTALGLAQVVLAHPDWRDRYAPVATRAAAKSLRPELRSAFTAAWHGEDGPAVPDSAHGHAYLSYPALALGMARLIDPAFPPDLAATQEALVASYERRLLAAPTGLLDTLPGEAYPTDMAAVSAAIAVHGRATGADHSAVLAHWARAVRAVQIDPATGLVAQRMGTDGRPHDAPRASGTGLAAYFAGVADRALARELADGFFRQERDVLGFSAMHEYGPGYDGGGDIDSGPVILGISVSATAFALAPARAFGHRDIFTRVLRTTDLVGIPLRSGDRLRFANGGVIGNALLLAFLTSGPELAR
ncbi:hypothetical protein [Nocardia seriolae]|uniref:hypothetical protein n=1 Tax=Nocardia seriolae TaxID=37332 RepID=UPI0008FF2124|nr:hypothetical protein [Nocardia seriolae]OJF79460.1 hypothetical protein NS14008_09930 [Nocardia seriolae]PSK27243.1 hypothetical protein C6575_32940 [Nocardia seriolae]QOW36628.1 hypothetical protein IMZ23_18310 [Nocardia seriolae]QUN15858.1 hypothetical protein KEC46_26590 [Nocardia seriolae]WNJ57105.1 hypothetical protein RMO66_27215 [Nocardia seriolae]